MKREGEKAFYPLDRQLGFERYRRYTPYLEFCVVKLAARSVYRVVEESIKILSPVTISHQKVLAGLQNEELEAALSSKFKPVKAPKSAELRKALRSALKKSPMVPHVGMRNGGIGGYTASSTAIGHLSSIFRI
ncbi:hypothetical protein [Phocaeicola sp.]|uniref:hypothetical protein n=1 Tax=Phocaeicola sp. TaxID=2773926 RepID=UPI003AB5DC50